MRSRVRLLLWCAIAGASVATASGHTRAADFELSYAAGFRDAAGRFAGGTELRLLVTHGSRLYAGNGYWEDRPGPEGRQGPQILVLDAPGAGWHVDHAFADRLPDGRLRDLAVGALAEVTLATDATGRPLPHPIALLLASTWDLSGAARVYTRDDASGDWSAVQLAQDPPAADFLPQIRSFGSHRDRVTGADLVFAGEMPRGIFAGAVDPTSRRVRWTATPELDASAVATNFAGLAGRLRVSSFVEANGRLYAAAGQQVYERQDGPTPSWRLVYTNSQPGRSETGLRGLTAVAGGSAGQALLAAVEGTAARIVRIDPTTGRDVTELDLGDFLSRAWGMRVAYTMAAYNDMTVIADRLLIGLCAFVTRDAQPAPGHSLVDVGYGRVEAGGWYLIRSPDGRYQLRQVAAPFAQSPVAVRSIRRSPLPGDADAVYFAGFDANKAPAHNTAWVARAPIGAALGASP